jgi:hypothetical protein
MDTNQNQILTGKEGEEWDLDVAASWTKNHRDKHPDHPVSHFFGKEIIHKILNQPGCVGMRIYHAYDHDGKKHVIITGATGDGKDMLPAKKTPPVVGLSLSGNAIKPLMLADDDTDPDPGGVLGQQSGPCPGSPGCPDNDLTS